MIVLIHRLICKYSLKQINQIILSFNKRYFSNLTRINFILNNHWTQVEKIQTQALRVNKTIHFIMLFQEKAAIKVVWLLTKSSKWHIKYKSITDLEVKHTKGNLIKYLNKQVPYLIWLVPLKILKTIINLFKKNWDKWYMNQYR